MTAKKPDCIGERFGRVVVIGKTGMHPTKHRQLWRLQCDCGNIIERVRQDFDRSWLRNHGYLYSCGCGKKEAARRNGQKREKPDCTGSRFGYLTVLDKGELIHKNGKSRQLWRLLCDCGAEIEKPRSDFESGRQKTCGRKECIYARQLKTSSRNLRDVTNQRFGSLTAVRLSGKKMNINNRHG